MGHAEVNAAVEERVVVVVVEVKAEDEEDLIVVIVVGVVREVPLGEAVLVVVVVHVQWPPCRTLRLFVRFLKDGCSS